MHNASIHHRPRSLQPSLQSDHPADTGQPHPASGTDTPPRCDSVPGHHDSSAPLLDELARVSPDDLTPRQALELLYAWKTRF